MYKPFKIYRDLKTRLFFLLFSVVIWLRVDGPKKLFGSWELYEGAGVGEVS